VRWWFRGQPDAEHKLRPGIFRFGFDANKRLTTEQHLAQDFRVMSAGLVGKNVSDGDLYFLQQHYGMPTRLLDWTINAIAALYFAVSKKADLDGKLFVMDAYGLCSAQSAPEKHYKGIATSRRPVFQEMLEPIFNWTPEPSTEERFILAVRPEHSERRIRLQRGCFTFHVPGQREVLPVDGRAVWSFIVPTDHKKPILEELHVLGIDEFSIYGDLDALARTLKNAYGVENKDEPPHPRT
jgi:hypothetical protein